MTTQTDLPSIDFTFGEEFDAILKTKGDTPAVYHDGHWSTWTDWGNQSRAMAAAFQSMGVEPGKVVALQLPNSWEFLVAHAAAAMIGAVTFPIHMPYGAYELERLLSRVDLAALIVPASYKGQDRSTAARSVLAELTSDAKLIIVPTDAQPHPQGADLIVWPDLIQSGAGFPLTPVTVGPDTPLTYLASSGTASNRPKICVHTHGGQIGGSSICATETGLSTNDVLISASPFSNAFGISAIYMAIRLGLTQATIQTWNPHVFAEVAAASAATEVFAVPAQLRDLTRSLTPGELTLKRIRTGGSAASAELVRSLKSAFGAEVIVQWGMTEIGGGTYSRPGDPEERITQTIGRAQGGADIAIFDSTGHAVRPGQVGELVYRAQTMMREYLGDPERTSQAIDCEGWLHTGDLASLDADGYIYYHGRMTDFINRGGMKFSAVEVENVLSEMSQLEHIAIIPVVDDRLGQRAVAAAVVSEGQTVTLEEITAHLEGRGLAKYKWPERLVLIDEMPSTATGKIMRNKLTEVLAGK
ncbi:class I adenylate-forming enzyme family protein [Citricoccus nitrophenolicus]|uniref:class I adenylate-forming enzyme family protein n=1 Tax=Citricoccus nitrophenolicus TaxID=863575 RepID=UPI0031E9611A